MSYAVALKPMSSSPIVWRDIASALPRETLPFTRFYEEIAPVAAPTDRAQVLPVEHDASALDVVAAPVVLVGTFEPDAVVAVPRPARAPAPIAPYEELLLEPDLELAQPGDGLSVSPAPLPDSMASGDEETPARPAWDTDREMDEVIQDWFDKPLPEPPADVGGDILLT